MGNKRLELWREWSDTYWDSIKELPEIFPFIDRMSILAYQETIPSTASEGLRSQARKQVCLNTLHDVGERIEADVLFVAYDDRDNCLGVSSKIINQLKKNDLVVKCAYYQTSKHVVLPNDIYEKTPVVTLQDKIIIPNIIQLVKFLWIVCRDGFRKKSPRNYILRHPKTVVSEILKICIRGMRVEQMLLNSNVRLIVSPNEKGQASILFAVAKKLKIATAQYLHGVPSLLFTPFISNEFWIWSEITKRMLSDEGRDGRLIAVGALEYDNDEHIRDTKEVFGEREIRALFLSQLSGDSGWGITAFRDAAERFSRVASEIKNVFVRVRMHPYEGREYMELMKEIFNGCAIEFSNPGEELNNDVAWATHVYTASSTAILSAVQQGKHAFLLWNDSLDTIHGHSFFPDKFVIKSDQELRDSFSFKFDSEHLLEEIFMSQGAVERAVIQISKTVLC